MTVSSRLAALRGSLAGRPRTLVGSIGILAVLLFFAGGSFAWFGYELTAGLPDRTALRAIGDMAQSTTILDASDRPVSS